MFGAHTRDGKAGAIRPGLSLLVLLVVGAGLLALAPAAGATQYQRPLVGTFGSVEQPSGNPTALAVDPVSGNVLVAYREEGIRRYNPDGTPAPFGALGENLIDGKPGPGGKPCAEEPASCDETPQGELTTEGKQIAVSPTNGNIYVPQVYLTGPGGSVELELVDIFSPEGNYLGQLTQAGTKNLENLSGVAVDATGAVYIAQRGEISKFVPTGDPPVNSDVVANFRVDGIGGPLALGSGPSAGWLFALVQISAGDDSAHSRVLKVNTDTGESSEFLDFALGIDTVDPVTGNLLAGNSTEASEYDGSLASASTVLSRTVLEQTRGAGANGWAFGPSGQLYVAYSVLGFLPTNVLMYGAPAIVPTVTMEPVRGVTATAATLSGTVNPEGLPIEDCYFEWEAFVGGGASGKAPCEESVPTDNSPHQVHATLTGLKPNGLEYKITLAAENENGTERSATESFVTSKTVVTRAPTVTGTTTATLNGAVRPEGNQYTECVFEWGLTTSFGYEHTTPCEPEAGDIPADSGEYAVALALTGLEEGARYRYRLKATDGEGTLAGTTFTFEPFGSLRIDEVRARDASQSSATIEAHVDPNGFPTTYWFEWGPTASYGHLSPASPASVGSGQGPVQVHADLGGLTAGSTYHYRLLAESRGDRFESGDQTLETLDFCGLPQNRCYELVSRPDAGPIAIPGELNPAPDMQLQTSTAGGGLAYTVESGYPDATRGFGVLYRATRGAEGWKSTQLSTPILGPDRGNGTETVSGYTKWLSDNLACGFGTSDQALTDDPGPLLAAEKAFFSLFRLNPEGSADPYTAVPSFPSVSGGVDATVDGASQDCEKVIFTAGTEFPGVPGVGSQRIYEWQAGQLRDVAIVPGPGGEEVAVAGTIDPERSFNAVSTDGSRVFFLAPRQTSTLAAEIGEQGLFVREDGATTRDLSLSETSTPDTGATYQYATPDGSKVFFTANAGLTAESSPAGTDLYEYDLEKSPSDHPLRDLSVDHEPGGAEVRGFVAASDDGSHAYFIARAQFFAGQGLTREENQKEGTYSLYGVDAGGQAQFVATVGGFSLELGFLVEPGKGYWSSQVSADGRYLLFQTGTKVTGYDSGGAVEAYLYDSQTEEITCASCRPDGQPSVTPPNTAVLAARGGNNLKSPPQFLAEGPDGPEVFFSSLDTLAPGAVQGQNNVYEWTHGQVFRLTSAREGQSAEPLPALFAAFYGSSSDGTDSYFVSPEHLNWEDPDERLSIYDARVGGGFPEPAAPQAPCNADAEGSCHSPSQQASSTPAAASSTFSGAGNVKQKPQKKKPHKKKKAHHKKKTKHKSKKQRAKGDRGAGK
jgi:hypothetical protein